MYEHVAPTLGKLDDGIHEMLEDWNTLNWEIGGKVSETADIPDKTHFMRYLGQNMPLVIRGAAKDWACVQKWSKAYLIGKMGSRPVKVAITPDG
jgi:hypothetical protein